MPVGVYVGGPDAGGLAMAELGASQEPWKRPLHELTAPADIRAWAFHRISRALADHPNDDDRAGAYLGLGILMGLSG